MTEKEQKTAAKAYVAFWKEKGYENGVLQGYRLQQFPMVQPHAGTESKKLKRPLR